MTTTNTDNNTTAAVNAPSPEALEAAQAIETLFVEDYDGEENYCGLYLKGDTKDIARIVDAAIAKRLASLPSTPAPKFSVGDKVKCNPNAPLLTVVGLADNTPSPYVYILTDKYGNYYSKRDDDFETVETWAQMEAEKA